MAKTVTLAERFALANLHMWTAVNPAGHDELRDTFGGTYSDRRTINFTDGSTAKWIGIRREGRTMLSGWEILDPVANN